mmetsp:Transcript_10588/g.44126  ORF Transcript_10588/g.44126 Transcript_10588/m.44126 type:complete len:198 (+) Transcript_10588:506-1099(+)
MASLYEEFKPSRGGKYVDRRFRGSSEERAAKLAASTTLYIGNLAFYTSEDQLWTAFSRFGEVKRVIMGLDRNLKTPCGFCFVEYYRREDAQNAIWIINGVKVDDRLIRADWDIGFEPGRQYGRGRSGAWLAKRFATALYSNYILRFIVHTMAQVVKLGTMSDLLMTREGVDTARRQWKVTEHATACSCGVRQVSLTR